MDGKFTKSHHVATKPGFRRVWLHNRDFTKPFGRIPTREAPEHRTFDTPLHNDAGLSGGSNQAT